MMKKHNWFGPALTALALAFGLPHQAAAQTVYIGGGDNSPGAFDGYLSNPNGWSYVRSHAAGYYINNFALNANPNDTTQAGKLQQMANLFTNKNVFYETDQARSDDYTDKVNIDILRLYFNGPTYATLNDGWTGSRITALQWRAWKIAEPALVNVMRRTGAPCIVKGYVEGKDYERIEDPNLGNKPWPGEYTVWHEPPTIKTLRRASSVIRSSRQPPVIRPG